MRYFLVTYLLLPFLLTAQRTNKPNNDYNIYIGPNYVTVGYTTKANYSVIGTIRHDVIIQEALNNITKTGGGVVHILEGEYTLYWNLFIEDNIHLKGDGMFKTILRLADKAPAWRNGSYKKSGFVRARLTDNLIVSNLTLDGNKHNQLNDADHHYGRYGLFTEGCNHVWFDNVRITNFQGYGFDPHGWKAGGIWGEYLTITNCLSDYNDWDGYTLDQTYYIDVINCTARYNGRHGFNIVTGSKFVTLQNNNAIGNGYYYKDLHESGKNGSGCGYMTQNNKYFGTSHIRVMENYAKNNKKAEICVNDVHNVVIRDNLLDGSCTCLHAVNVKTIEFIHNECRTNKFVRTVNSTIATNYEERHNAILITDNIFKRSTCDSNDPYNEGIIWEISGTNKNTLSIMYFFTFISVFFIY